MLKQQAYLNELLATVIQESKAMGPTMAYNAMDASLSSTLAAKKHWEPATSVDETETENVAMKAVVTDPPPFSKDSSSSTSFLTSSKSCNASSFGKFHGPFQKATSTHVIDLTDSAEDQPPTTEITHIPRQSFVPKAAEEFAWPSNADDDAKKAAFPNGGGPPKSYPSNKRARRYPQESVTDKIPAFKFVLHTPFVVDAFQYGAIESIRGYFLSHFHSDHYGGLRKTFNAGPIYCSKVTADLVITVLKVEPSYVIPLPLNKRINMTELSELYAKNKLSAFLTSKQASVSSPAGLVEENVMIFVTLLDANHCPGSVCFLFEIEQKASGKVYTIFHAGDFRAASCLIQNPILDPFRIYKDDDDDTSTRDRDLRNLDLVYLDTTYSDPKYKFPSQDFILSELSSWLHRVLVKENAVKLVPFQYLIVVGRYTIGKERIYLSLLEKFPKAKVYYHASFNHDILNCLGWPVEFFRDKMELKDPRKAMIHVVPMSWVEDKDKLSDILNAVRPIFSHIISIKPTGWTFTGSVCPGSAKPERTTTSSSRPPSPPPPRNRDLAVLYPLPSSSKISHIPFSTLSNSGLQIIKKDRIFALEIPYSEHSSYQELLDFGCSFRIRKFIPTVHMSSTSLYHDFPLIK